jgi:16S rRNA (guanine966-N2)-methyltransferase
MRITGGSLRSRKIKTPKGPLVEPVPDMVREAVFSILRDAVPGARVLDLFACSGSLGIEALSRDADFVMFVEKDPGAAQVIRQNLESLRVADRAEVVCGDALETARYLAEQTDSFDLAFVDPPYALSDSPRGLSALEQLVKELFGGRLRDGIIVFRQRRGGAVPLTGCGTLTADMRAYGSTQVTFLEQTRADSC